MGFFFFPLGVQIILLTDLLGIINLHQVGSVGTHNRRDHLGRGVCFMGFGITSVCAFQNRLPDLYSKSIKQSEVLNKLNNCNEWCRRGEKPSRLSSSSENQRMDRKGP